MDPKPLLRKPQSRSGASASSVNPEAPEGWGWPVLWLFLTQNQWEEGDRRVPGTVLIFAEGDRLKACLGDRHSESVGFVTLTGRGDPLDELEDALRNDSVDWRAASSRNRKKG